MIWVLVACALGLPAGFVLLWRVPLCGTHGAQPQSNISIVIPARNEERNLPTLLQSVSGLDHGPREVIVVDDASADATASIAAGFGARVIPSLPLPAGWTGKTWACLQGAKAAESLWLLFLDADTFFEPGGFEKLAACSDPNGDLGHVTSVLPYHVMQEPYEQLSLVFNLLMAFGAGGFGSVGKGRLFGQSLLISRDMYEKCGGHASVRAAILENLALYGRVAETGGKCLRFGGRNTLNIRMFPAGFGQMCESWTKAFADGAAASEPAVLGLAIFWLSALFADFLLMVAAPSSWRLPFALLYACFAVQVSRLSRQLGTYHFATCLFYPVPLGFFFGIFGKSLYRRVFKQKVMWRGRSL